MAYADTETPKDTKYPKIISQARKGLKERIDEESQERAKMLDDLRFCTLDQWPEAIRKEREGDVENGPRPCLTIDKINQYIVQVVNDMRQGKPGINVRPQDDAADVETAKILKGLIRNIEDQSKADIAYSGAGESSAKIGLGYFRVTTEYASPDSFDQEIFIRPIANTFSVYLGKHYMPDGSDAKEGWIVESMPLARFKETYPGKKCSPDDFEDLGELVEYWFTGETVTVVEYFCLEQTRKTLYFLADGTTITEDEYREWPEEVAGPKPSIQDRRTTFIEQLKWAKMTGIEVLEERDLPGKFVPIIEVVGREAWVEGKRILWGLVRPAKDSLRMYNYFASTITEKMGLAPKTPFIGAVGQFEGIEDKWRAANRKNYAYLEYKPIDVNGNALPAPQRVGPTPMEAALLQQMQVIEHDVQTSLGMFKAAVGETESQQSGRAILALQRESDTGTYHFGANLGVSIRHAGRIIVDLIPHYYDTKRVVRILGEDGEVTTARLDPEQPEARRQVQGPKGVENIYNPGVGKYDVAITVGPSYNTKRMEAAATLTEVVKSQPQLMPFIGDLLFRSLDFPYSDQIAQRMKAMLPPALQDGNDPKQALMQAMQKMQLMGQQMQEMQQENVKLKAGAQEGMAKVQIQAKETEAELQLQAQKQAGEIQLAREKAAAEIEIKRAVAEAEHNIKIAELNIEKQAGEQKMAMESAHKSKQLEFDKQVKAQEMADKTSLENEDGAEKMAPKLIESMQAIVQEFAAVIQSQQKFQAELVAQLSKPKTIKLGGIQRNESGITGASATVQ